uniref:Chromosome 18 open reading frame 63 n=1 Tax=Crocodylus porosus TaxID=8502 RepID=A0A7M4EBT9_CROPO
MNDTRDQSLFFISLPDLQKLCAIKITLSSAVSKTQIRNTQLKICRQLLFLHQDILSSPVPGTLNEILAVMAISLYKTGKCQAYTEKHEATMETPQRVSRAILQLCLSYTLIARLAPSWNKAGHLLVQGRDFMSHKGKQNAVGNVTETQVCISLEAFTIRLPPPELEDFDISTQVIKIFSNNENSVIQRHSILSNWCYVLPSLKMGQIISISHVSPPESPFRSYKDFQMHWKSLYGYSLPEDHGETKTYCNVYFKLIGEQLFTYPFNTIYLLQYFPRVHLEGILNTFLSDLKSNLPHLCGFPVQITSKQLYATQELAKPLMHGAKPKPTILTGKRICKVSPTQAPSKRETLNLSSSSRNTEINHRMELLINHPETCIFSNLSQCTEEGIAEAMKKTIHRRQPQQTPGTSELPVHLAESLKLSKNSAVESQRKGATRIIPIFKGKLLQMNINSTRAIDGNKKQTVLQHSPKVVRDATASKISVVKPSLPQVYKSVQNMSISLTNSNVPPRAAASAKVKHGGSLCDHKTEPGRQLMNSLLSSGSASDSNSSEAELRKQNYLLSGSVKLGLQTESANLELNIPVGLNPCTKRGKIFVNQKTTQILGERPGSKKIYLPICKSDKKITNSRILQHQTKSQTKGAESNIHRLDLNSTMYTVKREEHRESLQPSKKYNAKTTKGGCTKSKKSKIRKAAILAVDVEECIKKI